MLPPPLATTATRSIKRFAPLQFGKILGILYGIMGLIFLPFFLLVPLLASHTPAPQRVGILALGMGFMLFIPVMYAVMGFLSGVVGAWLYNVVAKWIGGIEVEVE